MVNEIAKMKKIFIPTYPNICNELQRVFENKGVEVHKIEIGHGLYSLRDIGFFHEEKFYLKQNVDNFLYGDTIQRFINYLKELNIRIESSQFSGADFITDGNIVISLSMQLEKFLNMEVISPKDICQVHIDFFFAIVGQGCVIYNTGFAHNITQYDLIEDISKYTDEVATKLENRGYKIIEFNRYINEWHIKMHSALLTNVITLNDGGKICVISFEDWKKEQYKTLFGIDDFNSIREIYQSLGVELIEINTFLSEPPILPDCFDKFIGLRCMTQVEYMT